MSEKNFLSIHRLENLTDGVYAIAMTLLVLGLGVPRMSPPVTSDKLLNVVLNLSPQLVNYVISFYILAGLWVAHTHQFHQLRKTTEAFLWINLLGLLLICLIPFSTDLVGDYSSLPVAGALFHLHMLAVGFCFLWQSVYVERHRGEMGESVPEEAGPGRVRPESLDLPLSAVAALAMTWWDSSLSFLCYLGVPLIRVRVSRRLAKHRAG